MSLIDKIEEKLLKQNLGCKGTEECQEECQNDNMFIGKNVIVRSNLAGVFHGEVVSINGTAIILKNARRLWRWTAKKGVCVIGLAVDGIEVKSDTKISQLSELIMISDYVEINIASSISSESINNAGG